MERVSLFLGNLLRLLRTMKALHPIAKFMAVCQKEGPRDSFLGLLMKKRKARGMLVQTRVKEKEERKKVANGIPDGIVQSARRKAPKFSTPDEIQRSNCRTSGNTPKIRLPRFVDAISDADGKENEGNAMVMRANVREHVNKGIREATCSRMESFADKMAERVTTKLGKLDENNEKKNSSKRSAAEERRERTDIVSEKFMRYGGGAGRKRNTSSDLMKGEGGEEKRLREENGTHKKESCVESEVKHGYHDDSVRRKSGTLLGSFGFLGLSQDQEKALEGAYMITRPSPHFWREIAKLASSYYNIAFQYDASDSRLFFFFYPYFTA